MAKVSYLIPILEVNEWLRQSLTSVDADPFEYKEIVLVNNGDADVDAAFLRNEWGVSTPIKIIKEPSRGVAQALNTGIRLCESDFIARLDADDRVIPGRTKLQVDFLQNNPNVFGVGGQARVIDRVGAPIGALRVPLIYDLREMLATLRFDNPYVHPSVMLRTDTLKVLGYDEAMVKCQDWDLWIRSGIAGHLIVNIDAAVIEYRRHPYQESALNDLPSAMALRSCLSRLLGTDSILYQRKFMLRGESLGLGDAISIACKEFRHIKNMYSLRKLLSNLYRAMG